MTVQLPGIGRNGLVNSVRRLSGLTNPGYRAVGSTEDFIAGMVAKLAADTNGNPVLKVANATDTALIGLFYCHKTTSFYRTIREEQQTLGTSPNTATVVYLKHANIKAGSTRIVSSTGDTLLVETTDYVMTNVNGIVTLNGTGTGKVGSSALLYISYMYEDQNLSGIDETLGSGLAATLEERGEVATQVYDTTVAYTLMGTLYANASGYITSTNGGGSAIGKVTKVPTSDDPELHFKLQL